MNTTLINPSGYSLRDVQRKRWGLLWTKTSFEFTLDPVAPLMLRYEGMLLQPDRHFRSDGGSVPPPCHGIPGYGPFDFDSYFFHDSGYIHGGLWAQLTNPHPANDDQPQATFVFLPMTRFEIDDILYAGIRAEGARPTCAWMIYQAVTACGGAAWRRYRNQRG